MTDVEQMFYCFRVFPAHRNFLRFLWHEDNDVNPLIIKVVIYRKVPFVLPDFGSQVENVSCLRCSETVSHVKSYDAKKLFGKWLIFQKIDLNQTLLLPTIEWMSSVHGRWSHGKLVVEVPLQNDGEYFLRVLSSEPYTLRL